MVKVNCENCGIVFETDKYTPRKTCSKECRYEQTKKKNYEKARLAGRVKNCKFCGVEFRIPGDQSLSQKFCSQECYHANKSQVVRVETSCPVCQKRFWYYKKFPVSTCSRECGHILSPRTGVTGVRNGSGSHLPLETRELLDDKSSFVNFLESLGRKTSTVELSKLLKCSIYLPYSRIEEWDLWHYIEKQRSTGEIELTEIFSTWGVPFERNTRKVLGNRQELDFFFPEHNVAVEFNGIYWHSSKFREKGYHLAKTKSAREKGIRLIHVWEHLWRDPKKQPVYLNMIRHSLGLTEHRIGARKTRIEKRPAISMKKFFLENNIQGYRNARDAYVLVDKETGEDLMCYTTGNAHFGKGRYDLEIARGACRLGYHVPGGATKLWKYILEDRPEVNSIVYYVDLNHYNGASVGILPGSELVSEQSSFWNWWVEEDVVKNREPSRHKEITQGYKDESIYYIDNAGTATYVWNR